MFLVDLGMPRRLARFRFGFDQGPRGIWARRVKAARCELARLEPAARLAWMSASRRRSPEVRLEPAGLTYQVVMLSPRLVSGIDCPERDYGR
jgi:hypothetical protein